jgi:hypothetical protein
MESIFANLSEKQKRNLLKISADFKKKMQRMVNDPKSGCTGISMSSPHVDGGKEFIIAERKIAPEKKP